MPDSKMENSRYRYRYRCKIQIRPTTDTDADTGGKTQREHKCDRYMCEHFHYCLAQLIYAIQLAFPDAQTDGRKEAREEGREYEQTDRRTESLRGGRANALPGK